MRHLCVAAIALAVAGCGAAEVDPVADVLTGAVSLDGKPANFTMIIAAGTGGKEVSGPRRPDGTFRIENPPKGPLAFRFADGPPPPGPRGVAPSATGNIPPKYLAAGNGLTFDYTGGKKTFDIELSR